MHYASAPGGSPNRIDSSNSMDAPPGLGPPPGLSHVPTSTTMPSGPGLGSSNSLSRHQSAQLEVMTLVLVIIDHSVRLRALNVNDAAPGNHCGSGRYIAAPSAADRNCLLPIPTLLSLPQRPHAWQRKIISTSKPHAHCSLVIGLSTSAHAGQLRLQCKVHPKKTGRPM